MHLKIALPFLLLVCFPHLSAAENALAGDRQVEVGLGLAAPLLQGGTELLRARQIRSNAESYFERADGTRRDVGRYPAPLGFSLHVGFHEPIQRVRGLMLGAVTRTTLTGSQPRHGSYAEGYFFNSLTLSFAGKYYPSARRNLFLRGEAGVGAVLTKNRFLDDGGEQRYFHQFGIGPAAAVGVGYSLRPFASRETRVEIQALYQQLLTRVEVDGLGNDQWRTGAFQVIVGLGF